MLKNNYSILLLCYCRIEPNFDHSRYQQLGFPLTHQLCPRLL